MTFSTCGQFESRKTNVMMFFFFQTQHRFLHKKHLFNICMLMKNFFLKVINWEQKCNFKRNCESSMSALPHWYCPILLTCQLHTDYTVSAHDILIFKQFSIVFARCTDNNQRLDVFIVQVCRIVDMDCSSPVV